MRKKYAKQTGKLVNVSRFQKMKTDSQYMTSLSIYKIQAKDNENKICNSQVNKLNKLLIV